MGDLYHWEKVFIDILREFGKETLERNLGALPKDRHEKNFMAHRTLVQKQLIQPFRLALGQKRSAKHTQ
ncbi:MAG: hypothetical protein ACKO13_04100, partial [Cytophagales bacterium]